MITEQRLWTFASCLAVMGSSVNAFSPPLSFNMQTVMDGITKAPTKANSLALKYTHLEINGMLWEIPAADLSIVIDPIASQLDFGIPWGYRANKKVLSESQTLDMIEKARPDYLLLSQGLDDHTHLPTLTKLVERLPDLRFIVAPSAKDKVNGLVSDSQIKVLKPGASLSIGNSKSNAEVTITATEGALVGPPWQARENGWLLNVKKFFGSESSDLSVYFEPHADVILDNLSGKEADIVISPVREQSLPAQVPKEGQFTLVYGGERTLQVAERLGAKVVVPLGNGEIEAKGPLAGLVKATGGVEEFQELVNARNERSDPSSQIRIERALPGVPLKVKV